MLKRVIRRKFRRNGKKRKSRDEEDPETEIMIGERRKRKNRQKDQ